jgi:hypothetical protein
MGQPCEFQARQEEALGGGRVLLGRRESEKDAVSAQKLGHATAAFYRCIPTAMRGPTCIFWADLTPFSLEGASTGRLFFYVMTADPAADDASER